MTVESVIKPLCPQCKRATIYYRNNGTVRCRACGYDGKPDGKAKKV